MTATPSKAPAGATAAAPDRPLWPSRPGGRPSPAPRTARKAGKALALFAAIVTCCAGCLIAAAPSTTLIAGATFAATNLDGLLVLIALLSLDLAAGGLQVPRILAGHAVGIAVLTLGSILAASALSGLPPGSMAVLAAVPIVLGLRDLARPRRADTAKGPGALPKTVLATAAIVVSGGGDNVAVYTPLFHGLSGPGVAIALATFLCMTALWSAGAYTVCRLPPIQKALRQHGPRAVPYAYIVVGAAVLVRSLAG